MRQVVFRYDEDATRHLDGHFETDTATLYREDTHWDGQNNRSVHSGGQHHHEGLYRTEGGRWVLHTWSQWVGIADTYAFISDDAAKDWLIVNGNDDAVKEHFGEIEKERGPGQPRIGDDLKVVFPDQQRTAIKALAISLNVSQAEMVRRLCDVGLATLVITGEGDLRACIDRVLTPKPARKGPLSDGS